MTDDCQWTMHYLKGFPGIDVNAWGLNGWCPYPSLHLFPMVHHILKLREDQQLWPLTITDILFKVIYVTEKNKHLESLSTQKSPIMSQLGTPSLYPTVI